MARKIIKKVGEYQTLCRDDKSGIAWVEDGSLGFSHSCHASIDATGSIRGMKKLGYWRHADRTVRSHGCIFNIDTFIASDDLDWLAAEYCQCGGKHLIKTEDGKLERKGIGD